MQNDFGVDSRGLTCQDRLSKAVNGPDAVRARKRLSSSVVLMLNVGESTIGAIEMAYSAEISRSNPSCFVFLVDQSGSMADPFGAGQGGAKKADGVADAVNRLLQNLVIKCAKEEGIRDFFHISVIGYGAQVGTAFAGELAGRKMVSISEVGNGPARVEQRNKKVPDGAGGLVDQQVRFPVWFEPVANGGTPMCHALNEAKSVVEAWIAQHPHCFPPIVINITDGEATDGDPLPAAEALCGLSSSDGNVLLFNIHLSSQRAPSVEYPGVSSNLPDQFAQKLFSMSSSLPSYMVDIARREGLVVEEGARGFVFNADMVAVIKFLDIGTRPSALR